MTCVFNAERLKTGDKTQIPYIVYEAEMTRSERNFKRLWRKIADKTYMNLRQSLGSAFCFAKKYKKSVKKVLTNRAVMCYNLLKKQTKGI